MFNRNLFILSIGQTFSFTAPVVNILLSGIIGSQLINIDYLSTLPTAMMIVGVAASTLVASKIMSIKGRRYGFSLACLVSSFSSLLCAYAIYNASFVIYCFGNFFIGFAIAFAQQYRFAASETVSKENIPRAISMVLLLGIIAALIGSNIVSVSENLMSVKYVGSYIFLSILTLIPFPCFLFYSDNHSENINKNNNTGSILSLFSNHQILQAISSAGVGYIIMSIIMTATPISMHIFEKFTLFKTGIVIQLHVVGMFLPSLITGDLIKKFGHSNIIYTGIVLLFLCIINNFFFQSYYGYMIGLILLGIGWNFLFVTGSSLLVISYKKEDKFRAQGLNDFVVFSTQAIGALSAGIILFATNWTILNLLCIPFLFVVLYFSMLANKSSQKT
ncbi:MAG: hypothetical protein CFH14_00915 [Alphaproteobacteria bacterium MarineAlpha5_Bin4]|nr:MAG: hypothetical protein CFH14_00915 [Alphaproteobacteria bacterium MarineAlpha5_Bin4]|tara:strand:+ start:2023 stop:3189 length:1167 start_codon:yes stop_codon:yes gene_type:complete